MGIIIFFTMALFIFLLGVTVMSVTFYHWYKLAKKKKACDKSSLKVDLGLKFS